MPSVLVERHEGVLEITLNRPEFLNAVNHETIAALAAAFAEAGEDRAARAVLLRGAGTHFCAGGDITMFAELIRLAPAERQKALYRIVDALHPLLVRMRYMPKPVVAAVQGAAAGVGLSFVLAADLALAADNAVFTSGYIHLGTSPDGGMTATLPHIVGYQACGRADVACRPLRRAARAVARARQPGGAGGRARRRGHGIGGAARGRTDARLWPDQSAAAGDIRRRL